MNLGTALAEYAASGSARTAAQLSDAVARESLRARVRRGKRRANLVIAASVVGVVAFGAAAFGSQRGPEPMPAPSPSATHEQLPPIDTSGYLVYPGGAFVTAEAVSCLQIPEVPVSMDAIPYPGSMPPLPTWIEANRIYGMSEGLPPNYPIPLYTDQAMFYDLAVAEISREYPRDVDVLVALIADDGSWWSFRAGYGVIDVMPFDDPGLFVSLTPNPECQGGPRAIDRSRIPSDHYNARVMVTRPDGSTVISDYGDVAVVTGLPSMPFLQVTK